MTAPDVRAAEIVEVEVYRVMRDYLEARLGELDLLINAADVLNTVAEGGDPSMGTAPRTMRPQSRRIFP